MADPAEIGAAHRRRLREMWRSAGWPCHDPIELDLLGAGLLQRFWDAQGRETLRVTDAGIALEKRDEELAEQVRLRDRAIDQLENKINHEAARLIALRSPAATDLRVALSVIKIASSLERVGDLAKNADLSRFIL